jgi:hypothetical protein
MQLLPLLISAAKDAQPIIDAANGVIADFVNKGQITVAQQNQLHAHMDAVMEATLAGTEPQEFVVVQNP